MAAKKNGNGNGKKLAPLPKGFVPARTSLAGFFEREEGNSVLGILRGSFEVKGRFGSRKVFRIEVTEGNTHIGDGELAEAGMVIGLDETGYTKVLSDFDPGTGVYVRYEGKGSAEKDPHVFTVGRAEA